MYPSRAERTLTGICRVDGLDKDYGDINRLVAQKTVGVIAEEFRQRARQRPSTILLWPVVCIALKNELSRLFSCLWKM